LLRFSFRAQRPSSGTSDVTRSVRPLRAVMIRTASPGKGIRREAESEGSRKQDLGSTNRSWICRMRGVANVHGVGTRASLDEHLCYVTTIAETAGYAEYVRWCGRTAAVRSPSTRFQPHCCPASLTYSVRVPLKAILALMLQRPSISRHYSTSGDISSAAYL